MIKKPTIKERKSNRWTKLLFYKLNGYDYGYNWYRKSKMAKEYFDKYKTDFLSDLLASRLDNELRLIVHSRLDKIQIKYNKVWFVLHPYNRKIKVKKINF